MEKVEIAVTLLKGTPVSKVLLSLDPIQRDMLIREAISYYLNPNQFTNIFTNEGNGQLEPIPVFRAVSSEVIRPLIQTGDSSDMHKAQPSTGEVGQEYGTDTKAPQEHLAEISEEEASDTKDQPPSKNSVLGLLSPIALAKKISSLPNPKARPMSSFSDC